MTTERSEQRPRPRDCGIVIGLLPTGAHNAITDVPGLRVGHATIAAGALPRVHGVVAYDFVIAPWEEAEFLAFLAKDLPICLVDPPPVHLLAAG